VVRIGNVRPDGIDMSDRLYITRVSPQDRQRKAINPTTILMVGSNGNPDRVGNAYLATADVVDHLYASFLIGIDAANTTLARYLALWLQSDRVQQSITEATSGSTGLKNIGLRWLRDMVVRLPPVAEQRRIADLIRAVDAAAGRAMSEDAAAQGLVAALRTELIAAADSPRCRLGDVLDRIDGGVSPLTEGRAPTTGEPSVLKLSAVRPGRFRPEEAKALPTDIVMPEAAVVRVGDVLITRSNTPETVGYVCLVDRVSPKTYLSDLILRLHPRPDLLPGYLAEALVTDDARAQIMGSARGTSGSMRKISRATIREVEIPLPVSVEAQRVVVALLTAAAHVRDAAHNTAERTAALRSTLLGSMLSGEHEIPASYDRFLDGAA
jgi:hypothetical protein